MEKVLEEKLAKYYQREETDRRDIRGKHISEDILVYPDTCCLGLFLETLNTSSPMDWGKEIGSLGDEEGNHNDLEYMRDHIMPYLQWDIPRETSYNVAIFETMDKVIRMAVRRTNYWGQYDEEASMSPSPLYNPTYNEDVKRLSQELSDLLHSYTWKDFCFAVKMYIFTLL